MRVVLDEVALGDLVPAGEEDLLGMGQINLDPPDVHALCVLAGHDGVSRTTSRGSLSSLRPWNLGWRSCPSVVHSLKPTWPTRRRWTQCTPARGRRPRANRGSSRPTEARGPYRVSRGPRVKPVPALPPFPTLPHF